MAYYPAPGFLHPGPMCPWASIGENILVKRVQKYVAYQVVWQEQVPMSSPAVVDFGAIAANASIAAQSLQTPLEMDGFELGQWRGMILDDLSLQVYEPQNLPRFLAKNIRARVSARGQQLDPWCSQFELGVFQDEFPFVDVFNNRDYAITVARVAFFGFRHRVVRVRRDGVELPGYNSVNEVPQTLRFTAVMAEGFVGTGFERGGLGLS